MAAGLAAGLVALADLGAEAAAAAFGAGAGVLEDPAEAGFFFSSFLAAEAEKTQHLGTESFYIQIRLNITYIQKKWYIFTRIIKEILTNGNHHINTLY